MLSILGTLRDAVRLLAGWLVFAPGLLSILFLMLFKDPQTFMPYTKWVFRVCLRVFGIRVVARGLENFDNEKGYLFYCNHVSYLDPFVSQLAMPRYIVAVEKKENFRLPLYGQFMRRWGNIPIDRKDLESAKQSYEIAKRKLAEGICIGVLPEGTRTRSGELLPFKKGPFHLAIETQAEIVCFSIKGLYPLCNPTTWRIRPGTVEVVFSRPIPAAGLGKEDLERLSDRIRAEIQHGLGLLPEGSRPELLLPLEREPRPGLEPQPSPTH